MGSQVTLLDYVLHPLQLHRHNSPEVLVPQELHGDSLTAMLFDALALMIRHSKSAPPVIFASLGQILKSVAYFLNQNCDRLDPKLFADSLRLVCTCAYTLTFDFREHSNCGTLSQLLVGCFPHLPDPRISDHCLSICHSFWIILGYIGSMLESKSWSSVAVDDEFESMLNQICGIKKPFLAEHDLGIQIVTLAKEILELTDL